MDPPTPLGDWIVAAMPPETSAGEKRIRTRHKISDLQKNLKKLDKNGDGVLKPLELHSALVHDLGIKVHEGDLGVLWKVFDKNRDGMIDYMEMYNVVKFHESTPALQRKKEVEQSNFMKEWWMQVMQLAKVLCVDMCVDMCIDVCI